MRKGIWLLTGEPGAGKSTVLSRILLGVRSSGFIVGGVLTREIRNRGEREGFTIMDVSTEESEIMASVRGVTGPRIGKYRVSLNSLSGLGRRALEKAPSKDLIVCDEVGPMELLSPEFRRAVHGAILESSKPCVCVVHKSYSDLLIEELKGSNNTTLVEVTLENRETVWRDLQKDIIQLLTSVEK